MDINPNQQDPDRIIVPDEYVDRIYEAAHVVPNDVGIGHPVWTRKAFIGEMLQVVFSYRNMDWTREQVRDQFARTEGAACFSNEPGASEYRRIMDLVFVEVFGPVGGVTP